MFLLLLRREKQHFNLQNQAAQLQITNLKLKQKEKFQ